MSEKSSYQVYSLARGLKILELLAEKGGLSVSEVAAHLDIHRSVSHRYLATLRDLGYLIQEPSSHYRLSFRLFELGMQVINTLEINQIARPFMLELAKATNESVNFGLLDGNEIIYIDKIQSSEILRMDLAIGTRVPVYCAALGKAILAYLPEEEQKSILESSPMKARTPKTIINRKKLLQELQTIREKGLALDDEELAVGMRCIAAPVFDFREYPQFAISVEGPTSRMTDDRMAFLRNEVRRISTDLSKRLGHNGSMINR